MTNSNSSRNNNTDKSDDNNFNNKNKFTFVSHPTVNANLKFRRGTKATAIKSFTIASKPFLVLPTVMLSQCLLWLKFYLTSICIYVKLLKINQVSCTHTFRLSNTLVHKQWNPKENNYFRSLVVKMFFIVWNLIDKNKESYFSYVYCIICSW